MRHVVRRTLRLGRGGARLTSTCGGVATGVAADPQLRTGEGRRKKRKRETDMREERDEKRETCEKREI